MIKVIRKMEENEVICLRNDLTYNKATEILSYKGMPVKVTKKERLLLQILTKYIGKYVSFPTMN
ncbi:MAG: hypothetical protein B5M46_02390 [Epsilonproteobacteria bacterium 4484_20]|nr:MAG: hypothetical protein B5M46_02390 [Epsilonproteobacteria bacterium 4484_20]